MDLNTIVDVVITRATQGVTEQSFGTPLILGTHNRFIERVRYYASMADVATDFAPTDAEYIAAQDIFAQSPSPNLIGIGRRQVDDVTINVQTAQAAQKYSLFINGNEISVDSNDATYSVVNLDADLVTGNRIAVAVNGSQVGTVVSQIDFNQDFVASNSIQATVNGTALTSDIFTTDQATTIAAVADRIETATGVASATVTGPRQITVTFTNPGNNTVNSVITTLGASQPTANIGEGGFVYATSHAATMATIATAIDGVAGVDSAVVSGPTSRTLTVSGANGVTATVNSFVVSKGATQANASITNPYQTVTKNEIISEFITKINANINLPVTAANNNNGTFTLLSKVDGVAYTVRVTTDISNTNSSRVRITQVSPLQSYSVILNGINFTYTAPNNVQSADQIVNGLITLINSTPKTVLVTATNNGDGTFDINSDNAGQIYSILVSPEVMSYQSGLVINPLVASDSVTDDLDAVEAENDDWYALVATDRDLATVKSIMAWVQPRIKLFGTASDDPQIINVAAGIDTTSIAAFAQQQGYSRSFVMYHQDADFDYPEAAWFGKVLPMEPGSETWKFKTLNGVSYSNLTTNQSNNALNKNANTYEFVAGVGITSNGTVAVGEYIDVIRGIDWLTARIQQFVFSVLVRNPKVPYTDAGVSVIQAEVMRAIREGIDNDFLAEDPVPLVTVPRVIDVPPVDKANRILRNVKFVATLAGSVHFVQIRGTVSV